MTVIKTTTASPLAGPRRCRPVQFSQAAWCWYFTDTPPAQAAEKVRGTVLVLTV